MARERKKVQVQNTLRKATCYGIRAGESGFLEPWEAEHMCKVLKAGRVLQDPAEERARLLARLEASEKLTPPPPPPDPEGEKWL